MMRDIRWLRRASSSRDRDDRSHPGMCVSCRQFAHRRADIPSHFPLPARRRAPGVRRTRSSRVVDAGNRWRERAGGDRTTTPGDERAVSQFARPAGRCGRPKSSHGVCQPSTLHAAATLIAKLTLAGDGHRRPVFSGGTPQRSASESQCGQPPCCGARQSFHVLC